MNYYEGTIFNYEFILLICILSRKSCGYLGEVMKFLTKNLSIRARISVLLIVSLLLMAGIALVAIYKMQTIGQEFEEIVKIYRPIISSLQHINASQLEQALELEQSLLIVMMDRTDAKADIEKAEAQFFKLSYQIVQEIEKTRALINGLPLAFQDQEDMAQLIAYFDDVQAKHIKNDKDMKVLYKDLKDWGRDAITKKYIENLEVYLAELDKELSMMLAQIDVSMEQATNNAFTAQKEAVQIIITIGVLAVILGLLLTMLVARGIVKPINNVTTTMNSLAEGNLEVEIPENYFEDDISYMIQSVKIFRDNERVRRKLETEQREEQAHQIQRAEHIDKTTQIFDKNSQAILAALRAAAENLDASSNSLLKVSDSTSTQATTAVKAAGQTLSNVQAVAAATKKLSVSIQEINTLIENNSHNSQKAAEGAKKASDQIASLNQSATEIGNIISLIQDIAGQTNLLALNATIEASRAGEAGKGFSVVASEVKNLASQTSQATEQISAQIKKLQSETSHSLEVIQETVLAMDQITEDSETIVAAIDQQNSATSEISKNIQIASTETAEATNQITKVKNSTKDTENASNDVRQVVIDLNERSTALQNNILQFIENISSA